MFFAVPDFVKQLVAEMQDTDTRSLCIPFIFGLAHFFDVLFELVHFFQHFAVDGPADLSCNP
jgi:hypothetical protein